MLTSSQLADLDRDGFVAPLPFCSAAEMAELRLAVDAAVATPGPFGGDPWTARHQDCPAVFEMCASPAICDAVGQVLGPSLVVWNTVLMNKAPGAGEIPWHQDHDFQYLRPDVGLAVWLAVDDATTANGCLEVIPGSHRALLPYTSRTTASEFDSHVADSDVAGRPQLPVELRAGQFLLFWNKILHRSRPNPSGRRRLGLAIRYTIPSVHVDTSHFFSGYRAMPVRPAADA